MANRRVRLAACALFVLSLWHIQVIEARVQQYNNQNPQSQGTRTPQRQYSRQTTPQNRTTNQGNQQSTGAAAGSAKSQAAASTSIEKLDPEKRAAFLKLIGANWIWSPAYPKDEVPVGDCYFRKTFQVNQVELAQVHIACDNMYELYVNGRLAGAATTGERWMFTTSTNYLFAARTLSRSKPRIATLGLPAWWPACL